MFSFDYEDALTELAVVACVSNRTITCVAIQYRCTRSSIDTRTAVAVVDCCDQKQQIILISVAVRVIHCA